MLGTAARAAALSLNVTFMLAAMVVATGCATKPANESQRLAACDGPNAIERITLSWPMSATMTQLIVDQRIGSVAVRQGEVGQVQAYAIVQCLESRVGAAGIAVQSDDRHLRLQPMFAQAGEASNRWDTRRGRIDLTLYVPSLSLLAIETDGAGSIDVRGTFGRVEARSESGRISVAAAGAVTLTSIDGAIQFMQRDRDRAHVAKIVSARGRIEMPVTLHRELSLQAESCGGRIDADLDGAAVSRYAGCESLHWQQSGPGPRADLILRSGGDVILRRHEILD